jgi:hypothetical protein
MLGGEDDVERFVKRAAIKLGAPLDVFRSHYKLYTEHLPSTVQERLAADSLTGTLRIDFHQPPASGSLFIHRTHPLVVALADTLLERALESSTEISDDDAVARAGAVFVSNVRLKTTVMLLRLRHQLTVTRGVASRMMLCEETVVVCTNQQIALEVLSPDAARNLLGSEAVRNMPSPIKDRHIPTFENTASDTCIEYINSKGYSPNVKSLSALVGEAQLIAKLIVQTFTGMRDNEANSLP